MNHHRTLLAPRPLPRTVTKAVELTRAAAQLLSRSHPEVAQALLAQLEDIR